MKKAKTKSDPVLHNQLGGTLHLLIPLAILPMLLVVGGVTPGRILWGISQWTVWPVSAWVGMLVLYYALLVLSFRTEVTSRINFRSTTSHSPAARRLGWLALILISGSLFLWWRSRALVYGDGYIVLENAQRAIFSGLSGDEAVKPLTVILYRLGTTLLGPLFPGSPDLPCAVVSSLGGVAAVVAIVQVSRLLQREFAPRAFIVLCALSSSGILLFFGWVEHYSLALAALLWVLYSGQTYLETRHGFWRTIVLCILAGAMHFALWPLLILFLTVAYFRRTNGAVPYLKLNLAILISSLVSALAVMLTKSDLAIVPAVPVAADPYWSLSLAHLEDAANHVLLVAPLAVLFVLGMIVRRVRVPWSAQLNFLGSAALMLGLISFWVDPVLGAPRDWDLLSLYGIPLSLFVAALVSTTVLVRNLKRALLPVAGLVIMLIGPNLYEKTHAEVAIPFLDGHLWQDPHYLPDYRNADRGISWAATIMTYGSRADLAEKYFARKLQVDRKSDIALYNLGEIALKSGKADSALALEKQAYELEPRAPTYLVHYAHLLQQAGRESELQPLLSEIAKLQSENPKDLSYGGTVLVNAAKYAEALPLLKKTFQLRPWEYKNAINVGLAYTGLHQSDSAMTFYRIALARAPSAARQSVYQGILAQLLQTQQWDQARVTFREYVREFPSSPEIPQIQQLLDQAK